MYLCAFAPKCVGETTQQSTQWATLLKNNDLNQVQVLSATQESAVKTLQLVFIDALPAVPIKKCRGRSLDRHVVFLIVSQAIQQRAH